MPQLACQLQFRILETHDNFKKNLFFFSTGAFQVLSNNLCLKFRHCVGTASTYIPDRRQCQQSKNVFSSDLCLCAGSLLSVNLHHSLASWPLQHIALGSWLWCRFRLRFIGLGHHRGGLASPCTRDRLPRCQAQCAASCSSNDVAFCPTMLPWSGRP